MRLLVDVDPLPATKNEALAGRVYREKCHKLRHFPSRRHPPRHLLRGLAHPPKGRKTRKKRRTAWPGRRGCLNCPICLFVNRLYTETKDRRTRRGRKISQSTLAP